MKKLILLILTLSLICFGALGCGAKEKLEEKAAEKLMEEVFEQGGAGDVDIDGDKVTITGEEGEEVTFGGGEWPKSGLAKSIPEFKDGTILSTMEMSNYVLITFEDVEEADAVAYIEKNKPDFTLDNFEAKSGGSISWSGKNDENLNLSLTFEDGSFTIMMFQDESQESSE